MKLSATLSSVDPMLVILCVLAHHIAAMTQQILQDVLLEALPCYNIVNQQQLLYATLVVSCPGAGCPRSKTHMPEPCVLACQQGLQRLQR